MRLILHGMYGRIWERTADRQEGCEKMLQNGRQVSYEEHGDALVVLIRGEIDHHTAVAVRAGVDDVLATRQPERVFLDLSGVDFMDSSGMGRNTVDFTAEVENELCMTLPSLSVNEGMARSAVAAFCAQLNPTAVELADLKCAVSEAVTNCIVHAYRGTVGEIRIAVKLCEGRLVQVEISDRGCGIADVKQAREPLFTTDAEGERRGMGFTVMESFCDSVKVRSRVDRGTTVVLCKRLHK